MLSLEAKLLYCHLLNIRTKERRTLDIADAFSHADIAWHLKAIQPYPVRSEHAMDSILRELMNCDVMVTMGGRYQVLNTTEIAYDGYLTSQAEECINAELGVVYSHQ